MKRIAVLVPSRGRPHNIVELMQAWRDTEATAGLVVAVDDDDPTLPGYQALAPSLTTLSPGSQLIVGPRRRLGGTLNELAPILAWDAEAVGFLGDDHRPRTVGWQTTVGRALKRTGIVYGNDLIHGENLPTAAFLTSDIIRTLGWMCPPGLIHLEIDSAWLALGRSLGRITYLPDVVIEHMHPIADKARWDAGYREANSGEVQEHDRAVFERWVSTQLASDVERLRRGIPSL